MAQPKDNPATTRYISQSLIHAGYTLSGVALNPTPPGAGDVVANRTDGLVVGVGGVPDAQKTGVHDYVMNMDLSNLTPPATPIRKVSYTITNITTTPFLVAANVQRMSGSWLDYAGGSGWLEDMSAGGNQVIGFLTLAISASGDLTVYLSKQGTARNLWLDLILV